MQPLSFLVSLFVLLTLVVEGATAQAAFHFPSLTSSRHTPTTYCKRSMSLFGHQKFDHRNPHPNTVYECPNETTKEIYSIPNSGWSSKQWNWGSAIGTGHDAAMIARKLYATKSDRQKLIKSLLNPVEYKSTHPSSFNSSPEVSFEEVKLILGLAWQNGRWDGSDGGPEEGYSHVLSTMAAAHRYENDDEVLSALNFIEDVSKRFHTISRNEDELNRMKCIAIDVREKHDASMEEVFMVRRICAGMVLDAMGFVENGL